MSSTPGPGSSSSADPVMEELRGIRDELSRVTSVMTSDERVRFYREQADEIAASLGMEYRLHPTLPNARILIRPASTP